MKTRFNFPTRIYFGPGVLNDLVAQIDFLGYQRPLVVTDAGLAKTDIPERVEKLLKAGKLDAMVFSNVTANPTDAQIEAGATAYRNHQADGIIALGGGSPLDAGKAVQVRVHHDLPLEEYDDLKGGDSKILGKLPPLVAIPTTAGTGSEVSRSAVITVQALGRKVVIFSPRLMPALAICDPELTIGLPPQITAETGMDALSHNLEAYLAAGYHPMADAIAMQGIRMVGKFLPAAVENGKNLKARQEMLMASSMGAVAFQKGLGVVHSLAHPLSSVAGVSHGLANSIMLPHAMLFNAQAAEKRLASVAQALGAKDHTSDGAAAAVGELAEKIGLPKTLLEAGVNSKQIPVLVSKAMQDGCHACNPRECTTQDMEALFRAAL